MGTVRVVVLDMAATLETPRVRVTGEAGAAYRVRVEIDGTTRLTALRGALNASPSSGKGGATRIEKGLEAVFSPGGSVQVLNADPDAEDLAWLEKNR
jgi:ferric-dicitrate binding protein FerR (iron transport regulator)